MKWTRMFGIALLALLWVWLVSALFRGAGGFSGKNVFLAIASAIIIFVPLYKKYYRAKK
ncbi:MAG: hypothetical protein K2F64_02300 [Muribaculaceae bacterium]|nr:hypothetical protein [Muribaculaceae bacterium]